MKIIDLIDRPILNTDHALEVFQKMTREEEREWYNKTYEKMDKENVPHSFPEWNVALMSKEIDYDILYQCFKVK